MGEAAEAADDVAMLAAVFAAAGASIGIEQAHDEFLGRQALRCAPAAGRRRCGGRTATARSKPRATAKCASAQARGSPAKARAVPR